MRVRVKPGNPEARLMRYAENGEGLCASCAATVFLHSVPHIKHAIDAKRELLLWEPMQAQFAALMQAGQVDAKPEEIDWQRVSDCWDLPVTMPRRTRRSAQVREDEAERPSLWEEGMR